MFQWPTHHTAIVSDCISKENLTEFSVSNTLSQYLSHSEDSIFSSPIYSKYEQHACDRHFASVFQMRISLSLIFFFIGQISPYTYYTRDSFPERPMQTLNCAAVRALWATINLFDLQFGWYQHFKLVSHYGRSETFSSAH